MRQSTYLQPYLISKAVKTLCISLLGDHTLTAIKNGGKTLVKDVDYTVVSNTVTIKKDSSYAYRRAAQTNFRNERRANPILTINIRDGEMSPTDWANPFTDVDKSGWYYSDVQYVYQNGLFLGTSPNTFSPYTCDSWYVCYGFGQTCR